MLDPPVDVSGDAVLDAVATGWSEASDCTEIYHLPVGFGAHHWCAGRPGTPRLFVTLDHFGTRHSPASLEDAYASAAMLHLDFVVASLPSRSGTFTRPLAGGAVSCTPWLTGAAAGPGPITDPALAALDIAALSALHACPPPARTPRWGPVVGPDFAAQLATTLDHRWDTGPFGEQTRLALADSLHRIVTWTERYHLLAGHARQRPRVATHGEPHARNQMMTPAGLRFVDWESLKSAPRERDLGPLLDAGHAASLDPDLAMVEMFDLEWRLDEIDQYARWFGRFHTGTSSDHTALVGLLDELTRPPRLQPP